LFDSGLPYKWSDAELINDYANIVERKMCRRIPPLIEDSENVSEVLSTGTITIAGASGSIDSVKVNGITITSGSVPFNATIEQTATDLAANITAYASIPNYTAVAVGSVITISATAGTGSNPNGYVILVTATTLTSTVTVFTAGESLCQIYLIAGKSVYEKHPKILEIPFMTTSAGVDLNRTSESDITILLPGWRTATGAPTHYIEKTKNIIFFKEPIAVDTIDCAVHRLPLNDLVSTVTTQTPEIPAKYHEDMIPGILELAYSKDDEETFKPDLAKKYQEQFDNRCNEIRAEIMGSTGANNTK